MASQAAQDEDPRTETRPGAATRLQLRQQSLGSNVIGILKTNARVRAQAVRYAYPHVLA
jgi:hypothetical protein